MKKGFFITLFVVLLGFLTACGTKGEASHDFDREYVKLTFTVTSGALTNEAQTGWTGGSRVEIEKTFKTNPGVVAIFSYDALDMLDSVGLEHTSIVDLGVPKSNLPA